MIIVNNLYTHKCLAASVNCGIGIGGADIVFVQTCANVVTTLA